MTQGADSYVGHSPDSTGKKVDTLEVTRNDDTLVDRQRMVVSDAENPGRGGDARVRDDELQVGGRALAQLEYIAGTLDEIRDLLRLVLSN